MVLLWFDVLTAAQKSCEIDETAAATNLHKFAQILLQHAGEKSSNGWGRGLLGAIGIVKQQQISLKYTKNFIFKKTCVNNLFCLVLDFLIVP